MNRPGTGYGECACLGKCTYGLLNLRGFGLQVGAVIADELLRLSEKWDHVAMTSGVMRWSQCREVETVRGLLCSRRDLDPHLGARGNCRIVGLGAWTVVPVRLRLLVHDDGRWLYHDLRWVVVGRVVIRWVTPPRTPPGTGYDDAVPMKVAVESVVPVETVAAALAAAMASASMTHRGA